MTENKKSVYAMESSAEADRIEMKTDPDVSQSQLKLTGLLPGMRALDAGAGTGAVAREMARIVEDGHVVAVDQSDERIRIGSSIARDEGLTNLDFINSDLYDLKLEKDQFDYIWCRFVFEFLEQPKLALSQLARVTRPGGKIVVGDLDCNGMIHYPADPDFLEDLNRMQKAMEGKIDFYIGRKLFSLFMQEGLTDIRVHMLPHNLYAGTAPAADIDNWRQKFQTVRDMIIPAFGDADKYDNFVENYISHLKAPDTFYYSVLFLVEGHSPR